MGGRGLCSCPAGLPNLVEFSNRRLKRLHDRARHVSIKHGGWGAGTTVEARELHALVEAARENARLRALLDKRTALLRECEESRMLRQFEDDLSRRIARHLETKCDS